MFRLARSKFRLARSRFRLARNSFRLARNSFRQARNSFRLARSKFRHARSSFRQARSKFRQARNIFRAPQETCNFALAYYPRHPRIVPAAANIARARVNLLRADGNTAPANRKARSARSVVTLVGANESYAFGSSEPFQSWHLLKRKR